MIIDHRLLPFHQLSTRVSASIAYPFEWTVNAPVRFVLWLNANLTSSQRLVDENAQLRADELLLQSRLQRLSALEKENAQLRLLLQSSPQVPGRVQVARLLAVDLNPNLLQMIADKGLHHHVYVGQPVLDAYGVMGQVVSVGPLTSKILLITDPHSAVPVKDERNGVRAVAEGLGVTGKLALRNVSSMTDIQVGDIFVTSGLGLRYPMGYPVGQVAAIVHSPNDQYQQVTLIPAAHLDQTEQVLLVWSNKNALFSAVQSQLKTGLPSI